MKHTKLLAILLALLLALGAPVSAMAVTGGVSYNDNQYHEIEDDIKSNETGVRAMGEDTKVKVIGNVTVENDIPTELYGIFLAGGGSAEVTGNTTVGGSGSEYRTGIRIYNSNENSAVIGGNLSVSSPNFIAYGVNTFNAVDNYFSIGGDLSADSTNGEAHGAYINGGANNCLEVGGDLSATGNSAYGLDIVYTDKNTITVNGVTRVESKDYSAVGIELRGPAENEIFLNDGLTVTSDNSNAWGVYSSENSHDNTVIIDGDLTVNAGKDCEATGIELYGTNDYVGIGGKLEISGGYGFAISVNGKGNEVSVDGDVISHTIGYAVRAYEEGTVNVGGSIEGRHGVITNENGEVTAGSIEAQETAIDAIRGGTVLVNGDVKFGVNGISTSDNANIDIVGDLTATDPARAVSAVYIMVPGNTDPTGSIIVRGTIDGGDGDAIYIENYNGKSDVENYIPEIYLHTVESDDGQFITVYDVDSLHDADEDVYKAINYIIDTTDLKHGKITVQGANVMPDGTYYAHEDETITINVQVDKGYKLKNVTGGATLEKAADGSYILTVPRGGGITIDAIIKAVKTAQAKTDIVLYRDLDILSDRKALQLVRAINGVDVCGDASSYEEANKFEVIDEDITAMIKDVENGDFSAVTCELKDGVKVISQALHLTVNEKKDLTLFLDNAPAGASILFYDLTTGEWSTMGSFDGDNLAKVTLPGSGFAFAIA